MSKYLAREDGEVVSLWWKEPRVLVGVKGARGYASLILVDDNGKQHQLRRARVICAAFHGPCPPGWVVRHLDGSRYNDAPSNLAWGTYKQNAADKWTHGTQQTGERHGLSKLTEDNVRFIRANPRMMLTELGKMFGVQKTAIWSVRHGKTWSWLK
jgi:hypothetical protein